MNTVYSKTAPSLKHLNIFLTDAIICVFLIFFFCNGTFFVVNDSCLLFLFFFFLCRSKGTVKIATQCRTDRNYEDMKKTVLS